MVAGALGGLDFIVGEPTLGADQERQARWLGVADHRFCHRVQHQLQIRLGLLEPVCQQERGVNHRHR